MNNAHDENYAEELLHEDDTSLPRYLVNGLSDEEELERTLNEKLKRKKMLVLSDDTMDEIYEVSREINKYCAKNGILLFNKVNTQKYFIDTLSSIET